MSDATPGRILVDLPNRENRVKILRVILAEEELTEGFDYDELSRITDGYSGSDLKVILENDVLVLLS